MSFADRLVALGAQFPDLRAQPGLLVSLAQSTGSDDQIRDAASFAQATSWRRVLESVPSDHAQVMWDQLTPTDRQRVLGSGYRPLIEQNEGRGFWALNAPQPPVSAPEAAVPAAQDAAPAPQDAVPAPQEAPVPAPEPVTPDTAPPAPGLPAEMPDDPMGGDGGGVS